MVVTLLCAALLQAAAPKTDTTAKPTDVRDATARVTFDFGNGAGDTVSVHGFELQVTNGGPAALPATTTPAAQLAGSAQVKFERAPGAYTADLAAHGASGQRIPAVTVEVLDGTGKPAMTLHLVDVLVASEHVGIMDRTAEEQQKLALLDAVAQSTADDQVRGSGIPYYEWDFPDGSAVLVYEELYGSAITNPKTYVTFYRSTNDIRLNP